LINSLDDKDFRWLTLRKNISVPTSITIPLLGYSNGSRDVSVPRPAWQQVASNKEGYRQIKLDGRIYVASRLAWIHSHGEIPAAVEVDRRNGFAMTIASRTCDRPPTGNKH